MIFCHNAFCNSWEKECGNLFCGGYIYEYICCFISPHSFFGYKLLYAVFSLAGLLLLGSFNFYKSGDSLLLSSLKNSFAAYRIIGYKL